MEVLTARASEGETRTFSFLSFSNAPSSLPCQGSQSLSFLCLVHPPHPLPFFFFHLG